MDAGFRAHLAGADGLWIPPLRGNISVCMQDHELYRRILGIEAPWQVERVELQLKQGEVHVYLTHQANLEWACAECGSPSPLYDHQAERQWRHLDTC